MHLARKPFFERPWSSGGHFEEEVQCQEEKDEVGGPGGEKRGKLADAAHGFGKGGNGPVADADTDTESEAADGAATADKKSERDGEHHADRRDQRVGNFLVPLHGEGGDIEAGVLEAFDVAAEFAPTHEDGGENLAIEIGRRLAELGERGDFKGRVTLDGARSEIADPARLEDPGFFVVEPAGAISENAAAHFESAGVEFDDGESAEQPFVRIKEIVIVDFVVFAKNPALQGSVGLRRLALDDGAVGVLTLVGVGQVGVVEDEEREGDGETGEKQRHRETIEGNAAGLEGHDFVVLTENADGDENGNEGAKRSELVDGVGNEVAEIVHHHDKGGVVAADVFGQFEEGEDFEEEEEGEHDEEELVEEASKDVEIDDGRKTRVNGGGDGAVFGTGRGDAGANGSFATAEEPAESAVAREKTGERRFAAIAFHARKQSESGDAENNVGGPHAESGADDALPSVPGAGDKKQIVGRDDENGKERTGGTAAAPGLRAERNGDKCEDEAGDREGEALVEFDACITPTRAVICEEVARVALGIADGAFLGGSDGSDFDGPVAAPESGDGVVLGHGAGKFVGGAAVEVELQLAEGRFGHYNRAVGESDLRTAFAGSVGEEDTFPVGAAGGDVVDVKDHVRKALVEDAGLHGEGDLGSNECGFDGTASAESERCEPQGHEEGEGSAHDGENADGEEDPFAADAE